MRIEFKYPYFEDYCIPKGFLSRDKMCHALFYYFITAQAAWKEEVDGLEYDDEKYIYRYDLLYRSIAKLYDVDPNLMSNYWPQVKLQIERLGLTDIPEALKFRQIAKISTIKPGKIIKPKGVIV